MSNLRTAAQQALIVLEAGEVAQSGSIVITDLRAALAAHPEFVETDSDLLKLIETLQRRYGLSFLGSEKCLRHFARDWIFLTTPDPAAVESEA
jgi:hypothetical protein